MAPRNGASTAIISQVPASGAQNFKIRPEVKGPWSICLAINRWIHGGCCRGAVPVWRYWSGNVVEHRLELGPIEGAERLDSYVAAGS